MTVVLGGRCWFTLALLALLAASCSRLGFSNNRSDAARGDASGDAAPSGDAADAAPPGDVLDAASDTICGDGSCDGSETAQTCPQDCGPNCGDGTCDGSEGTASCPIDCGTACGDGACNGDESACSCGTDCGGGCQPDGLYRSVGPGNTSALASGSSNALTIAGNGAAFAVALPDRVGVGDLLQYDADDDGVVDSLAFIHGRASATAYLVAAADGSVPAPTTAPDADWTLYRAYTSLAKAATGTTNPSVAIPYDTWTGSNDLANLGESWHIACYADGPDRSVSIFDGWTTIVQAYLRIFTPVKPTEVGVSQRHTGKWDTSRYHIETPAGSNDKALDVRNAFVRVEGLQIFVNTDAAAGDLPYGIQLGAYTGNQVVRVSHNIIRSTNIPNTNGAMSRGIKFRADAGAPTLHAWNNIIYDFGGTQPARGIELTGIGTTAYLYNNTIANVSPAILGNSTNDVLVLRNNVTLQCLDRCYGEKGSFSGSNNRTGDSSAPSKGVGARLSTDVITDYFVSSSDFHLDPSAANAAQVIDVGADLSSDPDLPVTRDIDGAVRTVPWDIGADES